MALLFFLFFVLLVLPLFFFLFNKHFIRRNYRLPPGPEGFPLIGNLFQIDTSNTPKYLWQLSQKYGPLMFLRLGFKPTLIVSSAKWAEEVLKTQDLAFCSRPNLFGPHKLSYNSRDLAFAPYSDYWREMRKICIIYLFNSNKVQIYRPVREDEVRHMLDKISESATVCKPVNLSKLMLDLTTSLICRIAFGKRYEDGGSEKNKFEELLNETQTLFGSFFISDYFPCMRWANKLNGLFSRLEKNFKEFDDFYQQMIDEHLDPNRPKSEHENILDVLLQIVMDRSFKVHLTFDDIKGILMNVFTGGSDTGAATVIWAMSFLVKHPKAMMKVQEEVRNLIGTKGFVNEDDIHQLAYLKAVVKETMRLQPTVPLLVPRETTQACNIGGYKIPAKTLVYVNAWAVGRDLEAWENPFEFNPDRFLGSCIDMKGQNFKLIPFGAGRRICPGMHMGIANVEVALANLLYKFDWEMPGGKKREDIDIDNVSTGIVVHTKDALSLVPKKYV